MKNKGWICLEKQNLTNNIKKLIDNSKSTDYKIDRKKLVRDYLKEQMDKNDNSLLLVTNDRYYSNPAAVIVLDRLYPNFALGHITNRLNGSKIPYTINYYSLIAKEDKYKTYRNESQFKDGDPLG